MECSSSQVISSVRNRKLLSNNCLFRNTCRVAKLFKLSKMRIFILTGYYSELKIGKKNILYNSESQSQLANLIYMFRLQLCKCSISKATHGSSQNIWGLILQCAKYLMQVPLPPTKISARQMFCTSQGLFAICQDWARNHYSF